MRFLSVRTSPCEIIAHGVEASFLRVLLDCLKIGISADPGNAEVLRMFLQQGDVEVPNLLCEMRFDYLPCALACSDWSG